MTYAPNFASERLLPGPPYRFCRGSADWAATDIATEGASSRQNDGRLKGKAARTADLKRGWASFDHPPDKFGANQGDVATFHRAMFSGLPLPAFHETRDFDAIWDRIGKFAVSLSVRLRVLPASSPLREFTDADHQIVVYDTRQRNGREWGLVIDPMHPHSLTYRGIWAPRSDIAEAAKAILDGVIYAESYPAGGWVPGAVAIAQNQSLRQEVRRLKAENAELLADLDAQADPDDAVSAFAEILKERLPEFIADILAE